MKDVCWEASGSPSPVPVAVELTAAVLTVLLHQAVQVVAEP